MNWAVKDGDRADMRRYKRYAEYKDSGVEWLGQIPKHWEIRALKFITRWQNGAAFKPEDWGHDGVPIIRIENLNGGGEFNYTTRKIDARYHVTKGDLLFGWSGNRGTSFGPFVWQREGLYCLNQHIFRFHGYPFKPDWFYWTLKGATLFVEKQAHGIIGLVHITGPELGRIKIPICSVDEQRAIAVFVDCETAALDALIGKKERLIELLRERRTALITHAVTKGLDATVPMKDSGVEWLGEIPAHWDVERIKWAARMESGHTPDKKVESYWLNGDIPWVSLADTGQLREVDYIADTAVRTTSDGLAHSSAHLLPAGTVVFSRDATIGLCAITRAGMAVSQHFIGWVCSSRLQPEYLLFVFRSMIQELERLTMGATVRTIGMPDVRTLVTPIPPLREQADIVKQVLTSRSRIDVLVAKVQDAIDRLKEYRTALISAAVTGKIDVRDEPAP